jgi:hypothetical protein
MSNRNRFPESNHKNLLIYRLAGIILLKKVIMRSIGVFVLTVNPREKMPSYFVGHPYDPSSVKLTIKWSYFNELVHFGLIFVTALLGYYAYIKGSTGGAVFLAFFVLLNIALALLQRMNRIRLRQTMAELEKRKTAQSETKSLS